jgi:hypothetical protein
MEFLTTEGTEEHEGKHVIEINLNIRFREFHCAPLCPLWLRIWAIAYDMEFSALAPLSAEC